MILSPGQRATGCAFGITSHGLVVGNGRVIHSREGGVLVDRNDIVSSTDLVGITSAWKVAVGVVDLRSVDGSTAETFTVILQSGVFVVVSFTESNTGLNGHYSGKHMT